MLMNTAVKTEKHGNGWLWIAGAACCFAMMGVTVKEAVNVHGVNIFWLGFLRFAAALLFVSAPALAGFWSLKVYNKKYFLLRGIFGSAGNFIFFASVALVGLGRGTVLMQLMGVFAALSAVWLLKEHMSRKLLFAVFIAGAGIIVCAGLRMPTSYEWLAVGGALCSGLTITFISRLKETDSLHVIFFSQSICGFFLLMPFALCTEFPGTWTFVIAGLCLCFFDTSGQYLMTHGIRSCSVAVAGSMLMLGPVIGVIVGIFFYKEAIDALQFAGCIMILAGAFLSIKSSRKGCSPSPE